MEAQVIADGIVWIGSDGRDIFSMEEAEALADLLESMGYRVAIET